MSNSQIRNKMLRHLDEGLAKVKIELQKNLNDFDPLDKDRLENFLSVFDQRLTVFQYDYLNFLEHAQGDVDSCVDEFHVSMILDEEISHMAEAIFTGSSSVPFVRVVLNAAILHADVETALAGTGLFYLVPYPFSVMLTKPKRRTIMRKKIVNKFDSEVAPKLREWAQSKIHE